MSSSQEVSRNEGRVFRVDRDADEQQMETETVDEAAIDGTGTQLMDEDSRSNDTGLQPLMQNATPAIIRSAQVTASVVNSPDEFKVKASRQSKKEAKFPPKSPEKDDDVRYIVVFCVCILDVLSLLRIDSDVMRTSLHLLVRGIISSITLKIITLSKTFLHELLPY